MAFTCFFFFPAFRLPARHVCTTRNFIHFAFTLFTSSPNRIWIRKCWTIKGKSLSALEIYWIQIKKPVKKPLKRWVNEHRAFHSCKRNISKMSFIKIKSEWNHLLHEICILWITRNKVCMKYECFQWFMVTSTIRISQFVVKWKKNSSGIDSKY